MANRNRERATKRAGVPNVVHSRRFRHGAALSQRARGLQKHDNYPYSPPEDWHEPTETKNDAWDFKIVVQTPGDGYRHAVSPEDIRQRLSKLSASMVEPLEVVQLSRMTRKKRSFPCYGMQWGTTLYLYPIEESMVEYYSRPPLPSQVTEAKMYGAKWVQSEGTDWKLVWTKKAIRDFYLNNILIHELGHLLDSRNTSYVDRERYAEWFAIQHGYKKSKRKQKSKSRVLRRHHSS